MLSTSNNSHHKDTDAELAMEFYNPNSLKRTQERPWFNRDCQLSVQAEDKSFKLWMENPPNVLVG